MAKKLSSHSADVLQRHYDALLGTYRQQSDLFLKSYLAYLAVVSVSSGYYFTAPVRDELGLPIIGFVAMTSVMCLVGTITGFVWVGRLQKALARIEDEFDPPLAKVELFGGRVLGAVTALGATLILAAALTVFVRTY